MESLATAQIQEIHSLWQEVQRTEDPSSEMLDLMEEAQALIGNEAAIDLAFLTASQKQKDLAEAFWNNEHDVIGWVGANRSGKSWGAGRLCGARWIRDRGYPGARVWCIAQTYKMSVAGQQRELWEALPQKNFSRVWNEEIGFGDKCVVRYRVRDEGGKSGWMVINFLNEQQDMNVFETVATDLVWWDEAQKESLFGRLLLRILDRDGKILISTLPQEVWLRMRIEESQDPRYRHVQFTTFDNERNLPSGKIQALAAGLSPEEYRMRILGEYVTLSGLCFPEFTNLLRPDGHVQETPPELPEDCRTFLFIDPGVHTAVLLLVVNEDGEKFVWDEVYTQGPRVDAVCDRVFAMLKSWKLKPEQLVDIAMDPQGWALTPSNELTLADEYSREGIHARRWLRTRDYGGGERAMINIVRNDLKNNMLFVNDRCVNTIREMRSWRWVMDERQKIDIRERTARTDNHACDCVKAWIAERPGFDTAVIGVYDTADDLDTFDDEDTTAWQEGLV